MAIGWQIIFRVGDSRVLTPDTAARRRWSAVIHRIGHGSGIVAHGAADTHGHVAVRCGRSEAGALARRLGCGLKAALWPDAEWEAARIRPIRDQWHLHNTLFYVLRQDSHHGVDGDPWHDATALPDLTGLRVTAPWLADNQRRWLPRIAQDDLLAIYQRPLHAATDRDLTALAPAAAAAVTLPDLSTRSPLSRVARASALQLGRQGWPTRAVTDALGLSPRTSRRLSHLALMPSLIAAIDAQWALRSRPG